MSLAFFITCAAVLMVCSLGIAYCRRRIRSLNKELMKFQFERGVICAAAIAQVPDVEIPEFIQKAWAFDSAMKARLKEDKA